MLNGLGKIAKALGDCCLGSHFHFNDHRLVWATRHEIWMETGQECRQLFCGRLNEYFVSARCLLRGDFLKFLAVDFTPDAIHTSCSCGGASLTWT